MKKYPILIILFIYNLSSFSQVNYYGSFESGMIDYRSSIIGVNTKYSYASHWVFYSDLDVNLEYKKITFSQSIINIFGHSDTYNFSFKPLHIIYSTSIYYSIKSFDFGYLHDCTHPIISSFIYDDFNGVRGSNDKIFVRVNFKK